MHLRNKHSRTKMDTYGSLLRALLLDVKLVSKIWFHPTEIDVERDLLKICCIHDKIKLIVLQQTDDNSGCIDYLDACYVREVWVSENTTSRSNGETEDIAILTIEDGLKPTTLPSKMWTKIMNIKNALLYLRNVDISDLLTIDLINSVHGIVGSGIIESAGNYRTTHAAAARTCVVYLPPICIAGRLQTLVSFVNKSLAAAMGIEMTTVDRLKLHLRVSTLFFSEFLKIHPFSNGNGRTARLLVNRLMMHVSVVPISIFLDGRRDTYLKLLGTAQWQQNPDGLAAMFLLSAKRTAIMAEYLLVTDDED